MPDNLTIQISADTGRARADLELLKGKLRDLGKEMRVARDEAMKTGDRTNLDRLAREYDAVSRSAKGLQTQLRATNSAVASPAWGAAAKGAAALNAELIGLAKSSLGVAGGVGSALLGTVNLIGKTKDQLLELRRISQATGFSPGAIKAVNEALEDTGQEAGAGNRGLVKLAQGFAEVRQAARNAGEAIGDTMKVMRGGEGNAKPQEFFGVDVSRGGRRTKVEVKSVADALRVLRVDMTKFKDDAAGNEAALQAIIDGLVRLNKEGKVDLGNLVAMQLWGKNMRETVPAMQLLGQEAGGLQAKMNELRTQGRFPTDEDTARALAYQKALKDMGDAVDAVGFSFLKAFGPLIQGELAKFANDLAELGRSVIEFLNLMQRLGAVVGLGYGPPVAEAPIPPPLKRAAGGMIRGPGSGTSDSILARLSNGEFVMRAAAVNKWGPQFMAALNGMRNPFGYAGGGLVPRFASGGLVASGAGGTPVHLHLGGQSFALAGNEGVVSALVTEAHRHRMRSAGAKPSWYGGR